MTVVPNGNPCGCGNQGCLEKHASATAVVAMALDRGGAPEHRAAIQRAAMDASKPIDEALVIATFRKAVKNLADARTEFEKGGRADLVAVNSAEIAILEKYLPKGLDAAKLEALVVEVIAATGATSKKEMGKVIGALKQRPEAPLIDFGAASKLIQAKLPPSINASPDSVRRMGMPMRARVRW